LILKINIERIDKKLRCPICRPHSEPQPIKDLYQHLKEHDTNDLIAYIILNQLKEGGIEFLRKVSNLINKNGLTYWNQ